MILVDTSVWIEFLRGNIAFESLAGLIEQAQVATIGAVFGELLQGARSQGEVSVLKEYWNNLAHLDDAALWFQAGLLSFQGQYFSKGIGLVDAAIVAAARKNQCPVWTLDKRLQSVLRQSELFAIDS